MKASPKRSKAKMFFDPREFRDTCLGALAYDLQKVSNPSAFHFDMRERWVGGFCKKFLLPGDKASRRDKAFAKFLRVNDEMSSISEESLVVKLRNIDALHTISRAKHLIWHVLGSSPLEQGLEDLFKGCKNSLGASIGVPFTDTSPERKFRFPISMTDKVLPLWEAYMEWDKDLAHAILALNEKDGRSPSFVITAESRASTVPKTDDIDRMIAVEPVGNMFFQHGLSRIMEDRLRRAGLSFDQDPELHRRWACWGSITNRLATVDFSSMSDRMSLGLCSLLLPKQWNEALHLVRCPSMTLQGVGTVPLSMISTMGNATTFPLETLVLWAIAVSCMHDFHGLSGSLPHLTLSKSARRPGQKCPITPYGDDVSVFGDDCILPSAVVPRFLEVCSAVGFVVNSDKTFYKDENFRESCGGDFFRGRDVRPFFLGAFPERQTRPLMESYLYSTINGVISKYIQYFGTVGYLYDKTLLKYLFSCLLRVTDKVKFVPRDYPEDSGITSLEDIMRFQYCYRIPVSPVSVDKNGMLRFSYLRFKFPFTGITDDGIRYCLALKALHYGPAVLHDRAIVHDGKKMQAKRNIRWNGTYVQAVSQKSTSLVLPSTLEKRWRQTKGREYVTQ